MLLLGHVSPPRHVWDLATCPQALSGTLLSFSSKQKPVTQQSLNCTILHLCRCPWSIWFSCRGLQEDIRVQKLLLNKGLLHYRDVGNCRISFRSLNTQLLLYPLLCLLTYKQWDWSATRKYCIFCNLRPLCIKTTLNNWGDDFKFFFSFGFDRDFVVKNRSKVFTFWYLLLLKLSCSNIAPMSHMKEKYMFLPRIL